MHPVVLKSNEFWGKRAGAISSSKGRYFHIKRGSMNGGTSNNQTPGRREYPRLMRLLAESAQRARRRSK